MAIIVTEKGLPVIVQGITGHQGSFHASQMKAFGTNIVGGVTPGKGGTSVNGIPVFDSVKDAVKETGAKASVVFVPAPYAPDAVIEAIDSGIKLIVIITEHIPFHDMTKLKLYAKLMGARIVGPNGPGITSVGIAKLGIMPNSIFKPGPIGVVSRSGTLTYEIVNTISEAGLGETTVIGIGGDQVVGTTMQEVVRMFQQDESTKAIVVVGEIGGTAEEETAEIIKKEVNKPVVAFIAGRYAPPGKRMGHAGAIITGNKGTAQSKINAFQEAGVKVASRPSEIPIFLRQKLQSH
ncbi:MAG: succinate--CoA ligase subunit alpha [Thaumarchaeota archaeon]|jgi:succinyl-CoA synthetase alpha subunit|nr:succinate--CoA ligase subunit alpha [Nitrososphaerota archaeon]